MKKTLQPQDRRALNTTTLGAHWELTVCRFLQRQGLRKIQSNYRCRNGEIDLIMSEGETLVFVEVRFRSSVGYARSYETISRSKQQRLRQSAQHYLSTTSKHRLLHAGVPPCRFDVLGVDSERISDSELSSVDITWIKNAF